ncbi:MAG: polysaccharide deacetylase, partial [Proteobacteria bacterium]
MVGKFVISLDFELHWGVSDIWELEPRKAYFDATRRSFPHVLSLFNSFEVHATWATVGFLFAKDKEQLLRFSPIEKPTYVNTRLSTYPLIDAIGQDESSDPYHYGHSLIEMILSCKNQELATHTFSHYYCREQGQTSAQFEADLKSVQAIAMENFGLEMKSLVFPRNQFNADYLSIAARNGIVTARSNPDQWFWKGDKPHMRLARLADTFMNIGHKSPQMHK